MLSNDPERPAGTGGFAGFIQNDGQIPALFAPRPAGWIGNEDLFILVAAQAAYEKSSEKTDFSKKMDSVWEYLKKLFRLSLDTKFIATRRDAIILNIPILIPIVALFAWGATIWLMLIGLFFGMRYRIDSDGDVPGSINNLMNHAADAADDIKQNLNDDK